MISGIIVTVNHDIIFITSKLVLATYTPFTHAPSHIINGDSFRSNLHRVPLKLILFGSQWVKENLQGHVIRPKKKVLCLR